MLYCHVLKYNFEGQILVGIHTHAGNIKDINYIHIYLNKLNNYDLKIFITVSL